MVLFLIAIRLDVAHIEWVLEKEWKLGSPINYTPVMRMATFIRGWTLQYRLL